VGRRPLSLVRCPAGIGGECFYQKHPHAGFDAIPTVAVEESDGTMGDYLYVLRAEHLVAAVQMGAIEFHVRGAANDRPDRPDRLVFDLDPDEGLDWAAVRAAAFDLRDRLGELGLPAQPMLTGGKGIHVWLPLRRSAAWPTVKLFAKTFAHLMAARAPERYTADMSKRRRKGRIFIDWLRNERGATAIAPWSVRARPGAPVAAPVTWDALAKVPSASAFGAAALLERGLPPCPYLEALDHRGAIGSAAIGRLERMAAQTG
jgi:bifunctional non-homologous end joining protein LigD